jgi:hypothetical protein
MEFKLRNLISAVVVLEWAGSGWSARHSPESEPQAVAAIPAKAREGHPLEVGFEAVAERTLFARELAEGGAAAA